MFERFRRDRDTTDTRDRDETDTTVTDRDRTVAREDVRPVRARGGIYAGAILTGVVVAFGASILLVTVIGGILVALGLQDADLSGTEAYNAGLGAAIGLVIAQFLAYMWGGYTAGRMGRGAGVWNGLLVPLVGIVIAAIALGIAAGIGAQTNVDATLRTNLPFSADPDVQTLAVGLGIGVLIAMFLGGAVGGALGARWHTKLEDARLEEGYGATGRTVDVRDTAPASTATKRTERASTTDTRT